MRRTSVVTTVDSPTLDRKVVLNANVSKLVLNVCWHCAGSYRAERVDLPCSAAIDSLDLEPWLITC